MNKLAFLVRHRLARLLRPLAGAILAVLALEGGLRLVAHYGWLDLSPPTFLEHDPQLGWQLRADLDARHRTGAFDVRIRTNRHGFRGPPWDLSPGSEPRILILGDSLAFGWGVEEDESLAHHLRQELPQARVYCAAVPGYGTDQQLLLLRRLIGSIEPDHVVLVYSATDALEVTCSQAYGREKPLFQFTSGGDLRLGNTPIARDFLSDSSLLALTVQRRLDHYSHQSRPLDPELSWQLTSGILQAMVTELKGTPLWILSHEQALGGWCAKVPAAEHLELDPVLRPWGSSAFQAEDTHWSPLGHRAIARALARRIDSRETQPMQAEAAQLLAREDLPRPK